MRVGVRSPGKTHGRLLRQRDGCRTGLPRYHGEVSIDENHSELRDHAGSDDAAVTAWIDASAQASVSQGLFRHGPSSADGHLPSTQQGPPILLLIVQSPMAQMGPARHRMSDAAMAGDVVVMPKERGARRARVLDGGLQLEQPRP